VLAYPLDMAGYGWWHNIAPYSEGHIFSQGKSIIRQETVMPLVL